MTGRETTQGRALITGAGTGLGYELAKILAGQGWRVLGLVRTPEAAARLRETGAGRIEAILGDVRHPDLDQILAPALGRLGGLEVLVNNAGISGRGATLEEADPEVVSSLLEVHCLGALRCTRAARPHLLAGREPMILNISSRMGSLNRNAAGDYLELAPSYAYRMAKASLNMLTVCLSNDPSLKGIRAATIHPGSLKTNMGYASAPHHPREAAGLLADLIASPPEGLNGIYLDLFTGETIPW